MKKILTLTLAILFCSTAFAQTTKKLAFTEASELNLIGKIFNNTPNPYHRVDTCIYKGWTDTQNFQVRCSAGIAVVFKTDSPDIYVKTDYGRIYWGQTTNVLAHKGYDLYIKKDGEWLYACSNVERQNKPGSNVPIVTGMDTSMKECLLYLPMYSEQHSIQIGVREGSVLEAIESPFRHRVAAYGSSYTQGVCCSRSGMAYPTIFTRNTGIQIVSLAMSGQCRMQDAATNVLVNAPDIDAFLFDTFSNPEAEEINERLFPFIEKIQAAHPGVPLIFQQTIYRENRNFSLKKEKQERAKMEMAEKLMKEACKKYKDVYFIVPNATAPDHQSQVDGIHPSDYGYQLWEKSIEKKVLRILKKYGIR